MVREQLLFLCFWVRFSAKRNDPTRPQLMDLQKSWPWVQTYPYSY